MTASGTSDGRKEWATDYWGEIMSEESEDYARKLAKFDGVKLYRRYQLGIWKVVA
jgi:hypothetical protein